MSPILVTLTSCGDSDFEHSNVSLKENKPDGVIRTLTISTTTFERMKEKFYGFRQTEIKGVTNSAPPPIPSSRTLFLTIDDYAKDGVLGEV